MIPAEMNTSNKIQKGKGKEREQTPKKHKHKRDETNIKTTYEMLGRDRGKRERHGLRRNNSRLQHKPCKGHQSPVRCRK